MKLALTLALIAGQAAAQAGCPTPADLDTGILLSMADGTFQMSTRTAPNGIEVTSTSVFASGEPFSTVTVFEHPLAMPLEIPGAIPTQVVYDQPVSGLDDLVRTREWTAAFEFQKEGATTESGTQVSRLTGFGQLTIGPCSYDVWRVNRTLTYSDGFAMYSEHVFAPDLGIILGETTLDEDGNARAAVFFDEIAAE